MSIVTTVHPDYTSMISDWRKFRLTYQGGKNFVDEYLVKFSVRESAIDFEDRKSISYCPAHAKAAINDIKNAIFQRTNDVTRENGSKTYEDAVEGVAGGVDLSGNTMNSFIGRIVLPELLTQAKVGVYVDAPPKTGETLADDTTRPYIYAYRAEDIRNWSFDDSTETLRSVLLRDVVEDKDVETGLVIGTVTQYRLLWLHEGGVGVRFFDAEGKILGEDIILNLTTIPFVIFSIQSSLLTDVADYQIALTNLASADLNYSLKSNFPFYTEQYDPNARTFTRSSLSADTGVQGNIGTPGTAKNAQTSKPNEINTGVAQGRHYPIGAERPNFIHPSSEPLIASMEKQKNLKLEIRQLVNLSLASISPQRSSAESKDFDERGLEAGLSYIGLELEFGERMISKLWAQYERVDTIATVKYPTNYSISSNEERRKQGKELKDLQESIPSLTFKREIAKKIVDTTIGADISLESLRNIHSEIDASEVFTSDPETLRADHDAGFVGDELASRLRGYPEGEVDNARSDHESRLERISKAQTSPVRGVPDTEGVPNETAKDDKNV